MLSFTERMDDARANAASARYMGRHTGKSAPGHTFTRRIDCDANSWEWLCREARREWRSSANEARNDFAQACLSGPHDPSSKWEFN